MKMDKSRNKDCIFVFFGFFLREADNCFLNYKFLKKKYKIHFIRFFSLFWFAIYIFIIGASTFEIFVKFKLWYHKLEKTQTLKKTKFMNSKILLFLSSTLTVIIVICLLICSETYA
uniref:(northern house mosquito) hypothetical protein n=1 Tax=Culex pipiens TaxID=7175 RepID=A0A8D8CQ60_CULPI